MGSIPIQQWKLLLVALTLGTFLEGIALWILSGDKVHDYRERVAKKGSE